MLEVIESTKTKTNQAGVRTVKYFRSHWVDYLLILGILIILGLFDIFVLQQSDNFLSLPYWEHAACRMTAYILAGILGIRVGYPQAKNACKELENALIRNAELLEKVQIDTIEFSAFIDKINDETKKKAWKEKVRKKILKLNQAYSHEYIIYFRAKPEERETFFDRFSGKEKMRKIRNAEEYCRQRDDLELLMVDKYIEDNIATLNVKYPQVQETDFAQTTGEAIGYKYYHTRRNVARNGVKKIGAGLIFSVIIVVFMGSFALSVNEALLTERVSTIISIIANALLDVGVTVWKFLSALSSCPTIVRQEDLRAVLDQNEILLRYEKENNI